MPRVSSFLIFMTLCLGLAGPAQANWELSFSDEFNGSSLDTARWQTRYMTGELTNNDELEGYTPDSFESNGSNLRIIARKRTMTLSDGRTYNYTSGLINSSPVFSQMYGYFEMRAKLPKGMGFWPAFWLLPITGAWPPEIDILEHQGRDPTGLYTTLHFLRNGAHDISGNYKVVADLTAGYHTFAVDWQPGLIIWYLDGAEVYRTPSSAASFVPNEPMYIVANLAVGGSWVGNPDATTVFPNYMDIDYIRAYKRVSSGGYTNIPGPNDPIPTPGGGGTTPPPEPEPEPQPGTTVSIFGNVAPAVAADTDPNAVELGLKFQSSQAGQITGIRFYRAVDNSSGFVVKLYSANGNLLASANVPAGKPMPGWIEAAFASPVSISANTTYVASYYTSNGQYAYQTNGLLNAVTKAPLTALGNSSGGNGVYAYGGGFPTLSWQASNYYVDVLFKSASTPPPPPVDTQSPTVPAGLMATAVSTSQINLTWSASSDNVGVTGYKIYRNGNLLTQVTQTSYSNTGLSAATAYSYQISAIDAAGNESLNSGAVSATTFSEPTPPPPATELNVLGSRLPANPIDTDRNAVELGVKFRSTVAGKIKAIRFYRAAASSSGFSVYLYNSSGTRLGTASIAAAGVTVPGYVQVNFATPIAISANTTYTASYFAPAGAYPYESNGIANAVTNGTLSFLAGTSNGGNGVYRYGSSGGTRPTSSYQNTNYFVDVVFVP
ncbi:MAG: DUF4082 domain-containing protein [Bdellovibrionaceae bacterium]|nr:DUF4082 domain-containing protein [Pseudobdellovibrionaceae bacterium]